MAELSAIEKLPYELLFKIFAYCPSVGLRKSLMSVCETFKEVLRQPSAWQTVEPDEQDSPDDICEILSLNSEAVKLLKLSSVKGLSEILSTIEDRNIQLKTLIVDSFDIELIQVGEIERIMTKSSRSLTALSVRRLSWPRMGPFLKTRENFVLKSLDLEQCKNLDSSSFSQLISNCPHLELLNIDFVECLGDASIYEIADNLPGLRALFIDGDNLLSSSFSYLLNNCVKLEAFGVSYARNFCDGSLKKIAGMKQMKYLKLKHAEAITTAGWLKFLRSIPEGYFSELKTLNLQNCPALEENVMTALASKCPNLEWFVIEFSEIGDEGLTSLVRSCPNLRVISCTGSWSISGKYWLDDVGNSLKRLQYVDMTMCNDVQLDDVERVAKKFRRVAFLNYYGNLFSGEPDLSGHHFLDLLNQNLTLDDVIYNRVVHPNIISAALVRARNASAFHSDLE